MIRRVNQVLILSRSKFHNIQLFSELIDFEQRMMLWTRRDQGCESSVDIGAVLSSTTSNYLLALIDAEQSMMLWSGCAQSGCVGFPPSPRMLCFTTQRNMCLECMLKSWLIVA